MKSGRFSLPILLLSLISSLLLVSGCDRSSTWHREQGMVWNTLYNITWRGPISLRDSIIPALAPVDHSLSVFNDSSLVCRINQNIDTPADIHFTTVYRECELIYRLSDGMFDPTLSPAISAWGFGKGHTATSDTLHCDSLIQFIGLDKTRLNDNIVHKDDIRTQFNLSAIAKGYGVDLIAEMFRRNGVNDFMIEIGGEIQCAGTNPEGKEWRIAIDVPARDSRPGESYAEILTLTDKGVATSGNYRNYHNTGGDHAYGHTISPLTCRPVSTDVISATVIADRCMTADALATTCMAVGSKKALEICQEAHAEALLILTDSTVVSTQGFKSYIKN